MKKILTILFFGSILIAFSSCTSCSHKKSYTQTEMEFRNSLTNEDTVQMLKLADGCMEMLKKKDFDGAIGMLHEYDDSLKELKPLSAQTEKNLRNKFKMFPVLKYERDYYSFMLEGLNDVRYRVWFAEEPHPEKYGEPVTKYMFNPIRIDGTWYLCVKSATMESDPFRR